MSGNRHDDVQVQVLVDGAWLDGWLDTWHKRDNGWYGFVRYQTAPGENYLDWFAQHYIRQVSVPGSGGVWG